MKRSVFMGSVAAIASLPASVFGKAAGIAAEIADAFKAKAGEGRKHGHIQLKGVNSNVLDVKISGSDTDGNLAIFEQSIQ